MAIWYIYRVVISFPSSTMATSRVLQSPKKQFGFSVYEVRNALTWLLPFYMYIYRTLCFFVVFVFFKTALKLDKPKIYLILKIGQIEEEENSLLTSK